MPASLSILHTPSLKKYRLTFFFLLFPLFFYGQSLTGLWTGTLSNDSTTIRKDQLFEIVLTEYRGKVYGYSRSEFIVNDTLYYIVKRVKGTITGDVCEVLDDDIISYNFRGKLDKGVKVTSTFRRNGTDSAWHLEGTWKTNATKKYYSVTGKVGLENEKDLSRSKIFPHLEELNLAKEVAFYNNRIETAPIVMIAKPEKIKTEYSFNPDQLDAIAVAKPDLKRAENDEPLPEFKKPEPNIKTDTKDLARADNNLKPVMPDLKKAENDEPLPEFKKPGSEPDKTDTRDVTVNKVLVTPKPDSKTTATNRPSAADLIKAKDDRLTTLAKTQADQKKIEPAKKEPVIVRTDKPAPVIPSRSKEELIQQVATLGGRKSEFSEEVSFKSDSLELYLYDNGEIDGDTVSVFMNGEMLMSHQGLKANAVKKTIYTKSGQEDFTIVLYADNLGKYPPNTGLLVVHDGEDIYHLRFSSDFQKSTGIVFRKKK